MSKTTAKKATAKKATAKKLTPTMQVREMRAEINSLQSKLHAATTKARGLEAQLLERREYNVKLAGTVNDEIRTIVAHLNQLIRFLSERR
jgi:predicted RNase H-like nuclease (RuvC/YqgF family)